MATSLPQLKIPQMIHVKHNILFLKFLKLSKMIVGNNMNKKRPISILHVHKHIHWITEYTHFTFLLNISKLKKTTSLYSVCT